MCHSLHMLSGFFFCNGKMAAFLGYLDAFPFEKCILYFAQMMICEFFSQTYQSIKPTYVNLFFFTFDIPKRNFIIQILAASLSLM